MRGRQAPWELGGGGWAESRWEPGRGAGSPSGRAWGRPGEAQGPPVCSWCLPGCGLGVARPGCSPAEGLPPSPGEGCGEGPHPRNQALPALGPLLPWGLVPTVTSSGPVLEATSQPPPALPAPVSLLAASRVMSPPP